MFYRITQDPVVEIAHSLFSLGFSLEKLEKSRKTSWWARPGGGAELYGKALLGGRGGHPPPPTRMRSGGRGSTPPTT